MSKRQSEKNESPLKDENPVLKDMHKRRKYLINETSDSDSDSTDSEKVRNKVKLRFIDPYFEWIPYKYILNLMYFSNQCKIKKGTPEHAEFWVFLEKYQAAHQKVLEAQLAAEGNPSNAFRKLKPKETYYLETVEIKAMLSRACSFHDGDDSPLNLERIIEFAYIIELYLNCVKKQKREKKRKILDARENLPISRYNNDIVNAVLCNQVVLVAGDTGCGKSTQVPQYLMKAGYDKIACTQPRRIACISLSKRVAYESFNQYGTEVGYQIRFEKSKSLHTKILFLTEGLLLRQVASDPMLSEYKVVILDEVHERHLSCDFLLGIMKCLTIQRPDLKILLMSATINIELFAEYFQNCPVIQVPGRLFPIEMKYYPVTAEEQKSSSTGKLNPAPYIRIMNLIDQKYPDDERGDVLIFLSGMTEISIVEEAAKLYAEKNHKWIILTLHSSLSLEEQDKVFDIAPDGVRKFIISTNIAETSITIDGVRFVVDSGKVKEMSYDTNCHMQRLQEFWISRASAEQRKGRAGRTGPGVCFRMYSQKEYDSFSAYTKAEIQRVPLDSLLLQMLSMGLPDARKFPFLEPPDMTNVNEALQSLTNQGALTGDESLTPMGQMLSKLPVDVTIGKMLIHGCVFSVIEPMLSLAAALSVQTPFTNRSMRDPDMVASRQLLESDHGDPFTLLNAYHKWLEVKSEPYGNSRKWCKKRGLEEQRFYEMTKLRRQFKELLKDSGLLPKDQREVTSSHDRTSRHGELSHLRDMKKQYHRTPHERKVLKLESSIEGVCEGEEEEESGSIDIRDVDFRISHNKAQVHMLSERTQVKSYQDIVCLKFIVCSGLYPRLALADTHNCYKSSSDQLFHTRGKPFAVLHPNGVFAMQPDLLQMKETDFIELKNFRTTNPLSKKHQMVAFMSLLETTKPYLVNCLRVSAAHVLLLLSHSLDTNQDFTRIVCDGWIEVRFPEPESIQDFISKAFNIRDSWHQLLKTAFEEFIIDKDNEDKRSSEIQEMGRKLYYLIANFFQVEIIYSIKRLLAADIKNLYVGPQEASISIAVGLISEAEGTLEHPTKGGLQVKEYLTYNCLRDPDENHLQYLQKHWTCAHCNKEMVATVLDQIRHREQCEKESAKSSASSSKDDQSNPHKKPYFCPMCQEEVYLTVTEILKHKKSHDKPGDEA